MLRLRLANFLKKGQSLETSCTDIGEKIGLSRMQVWRLAKAGKIPGTKTSKGGHFYFVTCPALENWLAGRRMRKMVARLKKQVKEARAAVKSSPRFQDKSERQAIKHLLKLQEWLSSRPANLYSKENQEYWQQQIKPLVDFAATRLR